MENNKEQSTVGGLGRLVQLMRPYSGKLLICMFCVIAVNAAEITKPLVAAVVIDRFLIGGEAEHGLWSVTGMGIAYLGIVLLGALLSMTQVRLIARVSQSILNQMRHRVFDKILHMPMKTLNKNGTGRLITRATNDVESINEFYSDVFLNLFRDVFLLVGIVIVMFSLDPVLAAAAMAGIPLIAALTFSLKRIIKRNFKRMKAIIGQINGFFAENVAGMRIVQAFERQAEKLKEFRELNAAYFVTTKTQVMLNSFLRPAMEIINSLVIALILCVGFKRVGFGVEVGVIYAFTTYVKQFFEPINDLAEKYTTVQSALVSTERVYEILEDEDVEDIDAGAHGGTVIGEVEFRDVWFAYDPGEWVLKGVSFKVSPGQHVAFVGATGVGKSTIISLIARYYTVQKGEILIDGVPIEQWKLRDLCRSVVTVLQDVFLFTGDVAENVDMHAGHSVEELTQAVATAQATDAIAPLGGLSASVVEQGLNFSTGERQLLSFARAVAQRPSILVLDEATAHIDSVTEERVRSAIDSISSGRTSIFIAHRLSTIRSCDIIFMMVDGNIVVKDGELLTIDVPALLQEAQSIAKRKWYEVNDTLDPRLTLPFC